MGTFSRIINVGLGSIGLRLQRTTTTEPPKPTTFYKPPTSCQIGELADLYDIFLGERSSGFFVEVGAFDGISYSNSSCLADAGWSGLLVEPIPAFAEACQERYANNPRIKICQVAAGKENAAIEINVAGAYTTTNRGVLQAYNGIDWAKSSVENVHRITVPQRRLDDILEEVAAPLPIDILIVDVEGAEASVFAGFTIGKWRPKMMIVELSHTHPDLRVVSATDVDIQRMIESDGYSVVYKDKINTVFVFQTQPRFRVDLNAAFWYKRVDVSRVRVERRLRCGRLKV
jgi:FkbM family methyltransferase